MNKVPDNPLTSEEEYRNIFETANIGLIVYDIEGEVVVEANPAACEMHGYTRQEFIGLHATVFMPAATHALFKQNIRNGKPGKAFEALVVHLRKDGTTFTIEARRSMIN